MRRYTSRTLALSLTVGMTLGLDAAAAVSAQGAAAALGNGGELYLVKTGTYGELFPGGHTPGADAANPVLAFDVLRPGADKERILVPGTEGPEVESLPSLFFEEASGTVFVLWESRINVIHPILILSGFSEDGWLAPISIVGSPFSPKTSPHFAVTRDAYQTPGPNGQPVTRHRTVVHVVWGEESSSGTSQTFYTPLFFEEGVYQGASPVYRLNDFDTGDPASTSFEIAASLAESPNIQGGRDGRTVVVGFVSSVTRRMTTLEIDVLPAQLAQLADGARAHIIDIGARLYPNRLQSLADAARAHIIDIGYAYHPELAQTLADQVFHLILDNGNNGTLAALGDKARAHIIDIGAKFSGRGLKPQVNQPLTVAAHTEIREIDTEAEPPAVDNSPAHLVQFRVASQRPAPRIGTADAVTLFLSADGEDALIAWTDAGGQSVSYRDSQKAGWSDIRQLRLSDGIDLGQAFKILEQKVRNR